MVADTENHPILIWNRIPDESGTPADIVLTGGRGDRMLGEASKTSFDWPWGVWTDGERLAITSTRGGWLLIWNTFPEVDDQPADLLLTGGGHMGTPRTITSDGNSLIVGDHNFSGTTESSTSGNFVWKSFPTVDELPYDFFMHDPVSDGSDIVAVGDRLYISGANGNHVLAYRTWSSSAPIAWPTQAPGSARTPFSTRGRWRSMAPICGSGSSSSPSACCDSAAQANPLPVTATPAAGTAGPASAPP